MRHTKIEWADYSTNPIKAVRAWGSKPGWFCTKVSAGCAHCYSEGINQHWGNGLAYTAANEAEVRFMLDTKELASIVHEKARPKRDRVFTGPVRVFPCDMIDLFHPAIPFEMVDTVFAAMALRPELLFMVLTKRPGRMLEYVDSEGVAYRIGRVAMTMGVEPPEGVNAYTMPMIGERWFIPWTLPNVQLGVSVENQAAADERLPVLMQLAAMGWTTFISYEPALGPVDLRPWLTVQRCPGNPAAGRGATTLCDRCSSWSKASGDCALLPEAARNVRLAGVIAGGESGQSARPPHPGWFVRVMDDCAAAGVPFFFKQWGEWGTIAQDLTTGLPVFRLFETRTKWEQKASTWVNGGTCIDMAGRVLTRGEHFDTADYPVAIVHRVGRQKAGRLLDGFTRNALPGDGGVA
jgi:protein gp37